MAGVSVVVHGGWLYGSWGQCQVDAQDCQVNGGDSCNAPACNESGQRIRFNQCVNPEPMNGGNDCWSDFSNAYKRSEYEFGDCDGACPPVDGGWLYGSWTSCQVDMIQCKIYGGDWCNAPACNEAGTRERYNECVNPEPKNGGSDCWSDFSNAFKRNELEIGDCTGHCPPVDGGWLYGSWGSCQLDAQVCSFSGGDWCNAPSCNQTGTRVRFNQCVNPEPAYGGAPCWSDYSRRNSSSEYEYGDCTGACPPGETGGDSDSSDDNSNGITAVCNDDNTLSVTINFDSNATIVSANYGSCNKTNIRGADVSDVKTWEITLEPSSCGMESNLRNLIYNQTAEFAVGHKDGDTDLVLATFKVDSYCNYTAEYTVTFDYGPVNANEYVFTESGGLLGLNFYIASFSNDSYVTKADPSTSAGDKIYLKLALNATLNDDFDHAANMDASTGKVFVPTKCEVMDDSSNSYTLFDVNGSKCKNDIINLSVTYNSGDPQSWYIEHTLFLLGTEGPSSYTLTCNVLVCDAERITTCKNAFTCLTA